MNFSQFNIDPIPLNAYLQLWQNLQDESLRDSLLALNFGWYYDYDDTIYDDRLESMKRLSVGFQRYFAMHRRLYYIHQQNSSAEKRAAWSKWESWYDNSEELHRFMDDLKIAHIDEQFYRHTESQFGGAILHPVPVLDRFLVQNVGGFGADLLNRAREPAERILRDGWVLLHQHYINTGYRFELRHPIAIKSPGTTDLIYRNQLATRSLDIALGHARKIAYDTIRLIEPTIWDHELPIRAHFQKWIDMTATARFYHSDDMPQYLLTPRGMPSVLALPSHDRLPVTTQVDLTPAWDDVWQQIQTLTPANVFDGRIDNYSQTPVYRPILRLGWLVAMAASILSMNLSVGSGQHRVAWIHSVLNSAHIGEAMMLAPMILHNARKVVNG